MEIFILSAVSCSVNNCNASGGLANVHTAALSSILSRSMLSNFASSNSPAQDVIAEQIITVQMAENEQALLTGEVSVLVSMGIEFGTVGITGEPVEVKWAGCGKVIAVR